MRQETRSDGSSLLKARITCAYTEVTLSHPAASGNLREGHQDHLGPGAGAQGPGVTGRERNDGDGGGWSPRKLSHMAPGLDEGLLQLLQEAPGDRPCTEI